MALLFLAAAGLTHMIYLWRKYQEEMSHEDS
jgi:hypothetical protein